jgi:membrane protein YdbS with pleckstrin-like domain
VDPGSAAVAGSDELVAPPHGIADGEVRRLDPRYVLLQKQTGWIGTGVMTALSLPALLLFLWLARPATWLGLPAALLVLIGLGLLAWLNHRWPEIDYAHASYRVDAEGLEIRRGVYFRVVINVPRSRIQHTDVSQGPLQRRLDLATLHVHTAGTENAEVALPGLAHETALLIRDHLLPRQHDDAV